MPIPGRTMFTAGVLVNAIAPFLLTFGIIYSLIPHAAIIFKDNRPFWMVMGCVGAVLFALGVSLVRRGAVAMIFARKPCGGTEIPPRG